MALREAGIGDLPQLEVLYRGVVAQMVRDRLQIWDEIYPVIALPEDIRREHLYLLAREGEILAAFALYPGSPEADGIGWREPEAQACVLERLAVRADCRGEGLGTVALREAETLARARGARCLRLLVVDVNAPAIALYQACGFRRAEGIYEHGVDDGLILREYGFEKELTM